MILDKLAAAARERVAMLKKQKSLVMIKSEANKLPKGEFVFEKALRQNDLTFITEIKKASPSKGLIAEDFDYIRIAKEYEAAGAAAISVLTEPTAFLGCDQYLKDVRKAVGIPLLRKDFTVDEYQIYEAKTIGADAVLLICALLDTETIRKYLAICDELGLSVLVEAHDADEVKSALQAGARVIGVNNRNLKDFTVDLQNSLNLRSLVPENIIFVSESGIRTPDDIAVLRSNGTDAVLIGETLMRSNDISGEISKLRGEV
ncbi:MAG: indole-3-glycerol phosphate synthase TrpC [Acidaminococcaceae bacterium]